MAQPFSVFRDHALARFDLPERALLIRLRFCSHLLTEAYHGLKRCRSRPAFLKRLQQTWFGPIPRKLVLRRIGRAAYFRHAHFGKYTTPAA